jgi:hypothetical protein
VIKVKIAPQRWLPRPSRLPSGGITARRCKTSSRRAGRHAGRSTSTCRTARKKSAKPPSRSRRKPCAISSRTRSRHRRLCKASSCSSRRLPDMGAENQARAWAFRHEGRCGLGPCCHRDSQPARGSVAVSADVSQPGANASRGESGITARGKQDFQIVQSPSSATVPMRKLFKAGGGENRRVVRLAGFEPATLGLEGRCSVHLSYRRVRHLRYTGRH